MSAYSFGDVVCTVSGPGGFSIPLASDAGSAEEGITVVRAADQNIMTTGADGSAMHSLRKTIAGTITVRLLKTSPYNAVLSEMFNVQSSSSALWGQNVIVGRDVARGDVFSGRQAAFRKKPDNQFAVQGNIIEWVFDCIKLDEQLGSGTPSLL